MAVSLYVNTFRVLLSVDSNDSNAWSHIYGSLSSLREALTCYVCRKLAINPVRPVPAKCLHNICKRCVGSRTRLKCKCKWCSGFKKHKENVQLRIVLQCYKKMCKFTLSSGLIRSWQGHKLSSAMLQFLAIVYEGSKLKDHFQYGSKFPNGPFKMSNSSSTLTKYEHSISQSADGQTIYSIKLHDTQSPKVMIQKATLKDCMNANSTDSDASSDTSVDGGSSIIKKCLRSVKKRSCRCGMATRKPGKLTCSGQKCPCYVGGRACINCRCRGCRNPQKNLITCPPKHKSRSTNDASPILKNVGIDLESFIDSSSSDSDILSAVCSCTNVNEAS